MHPFRLRMAQALPSGQKVPLPPWVGTSTGNGEDWKRKRVAVEWIELLGISGGVLTASLWGGLNCEALENLFG